MAKIKKQYTVNDSGGQELFYPATITDAVKNPTTGENVTVELGKKFDKESIVQEIGDSENLVMSQKAVTSELRDISSYFYHIDWPKDNLNNFLLHKNIQKGEKMAIGIHNITITPTDSSKSVFVAIAFKNKSGLIDDPSTTSYIREVEPENIDKIVEFPYDKEGPIRLYVGTNENSNVSSLSFDVKIEILNDFVYKAIKDPAVGETINAELKNKVAKNDIGENFRHVDWPKDNISQVLLDKDIKKDEAFIFLVRNIKMEVEEGTEDKHTVALTFKDAENSIITTSPLPLLIDESTGDSRLIGTFSSDYSGPLRLYIAKEPSGANVSSLSFDVKIEIIDYSVYETIADHAALMRGLNPMSLNCLRNSFFNLEDNLLLKLSSSGISYTVESDKELMPLSENYLAFKSISGKSNTLIFITDIKEAGTYYVYIETYTEVDTLFALIGCGVSDIIGVKAGYSVKNRTCKLTSSGSLEIHMIAKPNLKVGFVYVGSEVSLNTALLSCANLDLKSLSARSSISLGTIRNVEKFSAVSSQSNVPVDSSSPIVGYREPVDLNSDLVLNGCLLGASGTNTVKAIVGQIDQRGWLIVRKQYEGKALSSQGSNVIFFSFENAIIKRGESVYFDLGGMYWRYATDNINTDMPLSWTDSNYLVTSTRVDVNISRYELFVSDLDENFALSDDLSDAQKRISSAEASINASKIYEDRVTGDSYKLIVSNGSLVVKPTKPKSILIFGNSFTSHPKNSYWYGSRGMASSVPELDYVSLITNALGADVLRSGVGTFETKYTLDFDFSIIDSILASKDWDLVIIQLGENSPYNSDCYQCWKNLINYIKSKLPNADIIQITGWSTGDKLKAITNACQDTNTPLLYCNTETYTGNMRAGDYVTGDTKEDFGVAMPVILTHPSDVGMTLIANRILVQLGQPELDIFKNITLNQADGGTISVAYNKWPTGGLVSVKCEADTDKSISSLSVSGLSSEPVKRTNDYGVFYTFFMPDNDVEITPTWS